MPARRTYNSPFPASEIPVDHGGYHPFYPFRRICRERPVLPRYGRGKLFGSFCSVLRPRLPSVLDTNGIQLPAYDVIPHTGEILDPSSPDQHDGVFLEVVPFARNVDGDLEPVRQPYPRNLPQSGIRLFRGRGVHPQAYPPLLGASIQRGGVASMTDCLAPLPDKLVNRGHSPILPEKLVYTSRNAKGISTISSLSCQPVSSSSSIRSSSASSLSSEGRDGSASISSMR